MSKFWRLNTAPFFRILEHYMMPNRPCKQHIPFGKSLGKTIMTPSSSQISYVGGVEEGSEGVEKPRSREEEKFCLTWK